MMGFNRYTNDEGVVIDFISVLEGLDQDWVPSTPITASRNLKRKVWEASEIKHPVQPIEHLLSTKDPSQVSIEADMPLEYLAFGAVEFTFEGGTDHCEARVPSRMLNLCGLLVAHEGNETEAGYCTCWVNLPTFKSNSWFIRVIDKFAALIKLPSRITTYVEMFMGSTRTASEHLASLKNVLESYKDINPVNASSINLMTCEASKPDCALSFTLDSSSRAVQFQGRPPSAHELLDVLG
eukprot:FR739631.1.p1 GENE.FR739631.1~~FR739631.1.p1  ORF type:complete len:271 (+),score=28.82 FR739631.1:100-813(+)